MSTLAQAGDGLAPIMRQTYNCISGDQELWRHVASPGHNEYDYMYIGARINNVFIKGTGDNWD